MIYSIWNVRGLNDPGKVASVKRLLHSHSVDVVSLLETKIKLKNVLTYQRNFGSSWLWLCNYDHSPKGRIWLGWIADIVTVNVLKVHEQFIHCSVSSKDLSTQIHLTVVYGLHSIHDRLPLWEGLRSISIHHSPWLCAGDYNSVLHTSYRLHGTDVTDYETRDFQSLVDDLDLTEIKRKGAFYSWSNKAHTGPRTLSRIDRVFGNQAWLASHGHVGTVYLPPLYLIIVQFCWMYVLPLLGEKLNSVKSSIKSLNSKQFGHIEEKIEQANIELSGIQNLMAQNPDDLDLYAKESDAIKVVKHWNDIQESIFKQKSRINWIKLGNGNSHYFFSVLLKDPDAISHEIISFYKSLLGTQAPWLPIVDLVTMRRGKQLSFAAQSYLIRSISHDEIDAALKGIDNTKAPGIDGFNSLFFKRVWHIVKDDIYVSVIEFFTKGTLPKQWNCITITLVPKIPNASHVKDFRPIACCTVVYKLISKIITARLSAIIGEVIHDAQELGFPQKFVSWIWTSLTSVSYSILINGFPAPPFEAKKGLRKGGPMSPFLFAIDMEYLSRCLDEIRLTPNFNFHPRCEKLNLTHMMFADDLMMFSRADSVYTELRELLGVSQGTIPFRYLGVPFSSKKLTIAQCRPLVEKTYWAQIFILPKKILKEVEARFRCFLWTGSSAPAKKSLVAWNNVCLPKVCGGWNLLSLPEWNKAAVTKLLWDIAHKADNLWVKWVHVYYFKHRDCWTTPTPAKCSWFLKKILSCRDVVNDQGGWDGFMQGNKVKIKKLYAAIRPQVPKRNAVLFTGCCKSVDVFVRDIVFHSVFLVLFLLVFLLMLFKVIECFVVAAGCCCFSAVVALLLCCLAALLLLVHCCAAAVQLLLLSCAAAPQLLLLLLSCCDSQQLLFAVAVLVLLELLFWFRLLLFWQVVQFICCCWSGVLARVAASSALLLVLFLLLFAGSGWQLVWCLLGTAVLGVEEFAASVVV
ncbi:uncharacterized protein LOC110688913 [Chenopodium quinoa]|uniref:uncharacterized protein LOC110688913 n=1 Tax=Chenopodium quinoa TaxID=63459 RepID=UPI000B7847D0|nr:uncharacterized protein LOC110688913 [Chenopodium quinoa]